MAILEMISEALQNGKAKAVRELVAQALDEGKTPAEILNNGLLAGMGIIGGKFKANEVFVPEMLIAARAMNYGMEVLKPKLVEDGVKAIGKAAIGTVKGDLHDIGKNLVRMMFEGKGIEVLDLGVDVPAERFLEAHINEGASVIACSALLTTTMEEMKTIVDLFVEKGVRDSATIMVGGAPITESFSQSVGADYYAADATTAAEIAKKVLTEKAAG